MSEEVWNHPVFATREEFEQRVKDVLALEQEQYVEDVWWYMSFATPQGFLGGLYLEARGGMNAVEKARVLGLNPGGQVATWGPLPDMEHFPKQYLNRLLDKDEIDQADKLMQAALNERRER